MIIQHPTLSSCIRHSSKSSVLPKNKSNVFPTPKKTLSTSKTNSFLPIERQSFHTNESTQYPHYIHEVYSSDDIFSAAYHSPHILLENTLEHEKSHQNISLHQNIVHIYEDIIKCKKSVGFISPTEGVEHLRISLPQPFKKAGIFA